MKKIISVFFLRSQHINFKIMINGFINLIRFNNMLSSNKKVIDKYMRVVVIYIVIKKILYNDIFFLLKKKNFEINLKGRFYLLSQNFA